MFVDKLLLVSDAQAFAATGVSTDKIDLGASQTLRNRIGDGEPMGFLMTVDVAADAGTGDETYQFDILSDEDPALGSPTVIASFPISRTLLTAGSRWFLPMPAYQPRERYIGLRATLGGTTPSITITAALSPASMATESGPVTFYDNAYAI
jgi:hypothetical protein